jgi:hypothetical protein
MSEVDAAPDGPVVSVSLGYRNLRALFIVGFVLEIILTFVPCHGADGRSFSDFESIRWAFQQGRDGLAFLSVSMFCFAVACAALAIAYPRRWVFIAGACFAAFNLILELFSGSNGNVYFLPQLLDYVATAMMITGFWIKPPATC